MPRERLTERYILKLVGYCEVVRRQTLHLLPQHRVTINNTIQDMLSGGLIKERETGYKKHYMLTPKGRGYLQENCEEFEDFAFLPSNIRSGNWERLMLAGDAFIMLDQCGCDFFTNGLPPLRFVQAGEANLFYDATQVKRFLSNGQQLPSLQYSRLTGLFLAPDSPYRIYHTRNVAMEIRMTGERSMFDLLRANLYPKLGYNPHDASHVLLFGDKDMISAEKILYNTLHPNSTANRLRAMGKHKKKSYQITKLIDALTLSSRTYYMPLCREAMPLMQLYTHSGGLDVFREDVFYSILGDAPRQELGKILLRAGNHHYLFVADLHISWIGSALSKLDAIFRRGSITIICMDWQLEFWTKLMQQHFPGRPCDFGSLKNEYIEKILCWLEENPR